MNIYKTYYVLNGVKICGPWIEDHSEDRASKQALKQIPIGATDLKAEYFNTV